MLQGLHLAPFTRLCRLYDTDLQPTHILVDLPPVDRVPVKFLVGNRTSRKLICRHLLCLLSRFFKCSLKERPDGSLPVFTWSDIPLRLNSYLLHYNVAFAFSILSYPQSHGFTLWFTFLL